MAAAPLALALAEAVHEARGGGRDHSEAAPRGGRPAQARGFP